MKPMVRTLLSLTILLVLGTAAQARPWYDPIHAGHSFVNPHLTSQRVVAQKKSPAQWNGQLVLWEGVISNQKIVNSGCSFELTLADKTVVPVQCNKTPLTLSNALRNGCQAAVKGTVLLKEDGSFDSLGGQSVILLGPPRPWPKFSKTEDFLNWWITFHSPKVPASQSKGIAAQIVAKAQENHIDPLFFASLLQIESAYRLDAVSCSGAVGLGQLMPDTASGLGVDAWDPLDNVAGSAKMLGQLLRNFPEQSDPRALALASYNAGPNLVRGLGTVPAYSQTTNYVYFIGYLHHRLTQIADKVGVPVNLTASHP